MDCIVHGVAESGHDKSDFHSLTNGHLVSNLATSVTILLPVASRARAYVWPTHRDGSGKAKAMCICGFNKT